MLLVVLPAGDSASRQITPKPSENKLNNPSLSFFLEMIDRFRRPALVLFLTRSFSVSAASQAKGKKMPPKKAPTQEKKVLLGRPSNNLKIGIVGASVLSLHVCCEIHADRTRCSQRWKVFLLQCALEHRSVHSYPFVHPTQLAQTSAKPPISLMRQ